MKKYNYIIGDLYLENNKLFLRTILGEDIPVRETDTLRPLIVLQNGSKQRSFARTLKDILKVKHHIDKMRLDCFLFPGPERKFVHMKDGIPSLIDNKPGDEITVIEKYWELDEGIDQYRNGTLIEVYDSYFIFREDNSETEEEIYFSDIRNLTSKGVINYE